MSYRFPSVEAIDRHKRFGIKTNVSNVNAVKSVLRENGICVSDMDVKYAPTIQRISFRPSFKAANKLARMEKQFQFATGDERTSMTMESGAVHIDIPNASDCVFAGDLIAKLPHNDHINIPVGMDMEGNVIGTALDKAPHMLVAGCTGSGKSVLRENGICVSDMDVKYAPTIQRISFRPSFKAANKLARMEKQFQFATGDERTSMTMESGMVHIDVPNASDCVFAGDLIAKLPHNTHINIPVGMDMEGNVIGTPLDKAPHMLVAG